MRGCRGRTGGLGTLAVAALAHASAHVLAAVSSVRSCWSWAWRPASGARLFWLTSLSQTCLRAKIMRAAMIAPKLAVDRQSVRSLPVISARGSMPVAGVTCHKD